MEVLPNSIRDSIPKSNLLNKAITHSIIRQRKASIKHRDHGVGMMHACIELIVASSEYGDIQMVSCEDLIGLVNELMFFGVVLGLSEVIFQLTDVHVRDPGISIDYCEHDVIDVDAFWLEELLLEVFDTPRNVRGFSFLFKLFDMMNRVSKHPELIFEYLGYLFSFVF